MNLLGIRKDAQTLSWEDMRLGYARGINDNPNLSAKEKKESIADLNEIVNLFEDYTDSIHDNFDAGVGMLLSGDNDNGKTTLCSVLAREAYRARYDVKVITAEDISQLSRDFDNPEAKEQVEELITKYDILVIDELGKETEGKSKYNQTVLERIIKARIEKYELPTFVVSNLSPADIRTRYGNTIYSVLKYLQPIIITYSLFFRKPRKVIRRRDRE